MVRQALRVVAGLMAMALLLAMPETAMAATVTPYDGNISSTYTQIFKDILAKRNPFENYVFFRSGQNEYVMYVGSFTYENGLLTASETVTKYLIQTNTGYNSQYVYTVLEESDVVIDPGSSLVYSDLGSFPSLRSMDQLILTGVWILMMIIFMYYLLHWVAPR